MLAHLAAASVHGLSSWDREQVSVMVDDELSFEAVDGVRFFRSRRSFEAMRSPRPGLPVCRLEPAVLLWSAYDAPVRAAHGVVAAVVQQRLTTPDRLVGWLDDLRPLRRARSFRLTWDDVAGGAHSGAELAVAALCRRCEIAPPRRQTLRVDRSGRQRWTDCEWTLPDASVLVLEVDGAHHSDVLQAADDARRSRRRTTRERTVVRCTAYELRHEASEVAADLIALGLPGRVPVHPR